MPRVTTSAVRAPVRSMAVLIATVEPWMKASALPIGKWLFASVSRMPTARS